MLDWTLQKISRLGPTLGHTSGLAPTWVHIPGLPYLPISPWAHSHVGGQPELGPLSYTPLVGPLLWFTSSLLSLAQNEAAARGKALHGFQSFPNRLLDPSVREDRVQTLEMLHRPNLMLGNPDLTHRAKGDQHAPCVLNSQAQTLQLSDLAIPTLPPAARISAREGNWDRDKEQMWGFALAQGRKQLQDVFPPSPPLVNSQPCQTAEITV